MLLLQSVAEKENEIDEINSLPGNVPYFWMLYVLRLIGGKFCSKLDIRDNPCRWKACPT